MSNFLLLSGPFEGEIVEEGELLDVPFEELDDDLKDRIREWAEGQIDLLYIDIDGCDFAKKGGSGEPLGMDEIKQDYENRWDHEEVEEEATLLPASEWGS